MKSSSYQDGEVTLLLTGPQTLDALQRHYVGFFEEQGFLVSSATQESSGRARSLTLSRVGEPYKLGLGTGGTKDQWRVTLKRLTPG